MENDENLSLVYDVISSSQDPLPLLYGSLAVTKRLKKKTPKLIVHQLVTLYQFSLDLFNEYCYKGVDFYNEPLKNWLESDFLPDVVSALHMSKNLSESIGEILDILKDYQGEFPPFPDINKSIDWKSVLLKVISLDYPLLQAKFIYNYFETEPEEIDSILDNLTKLLDPGQIISSYYILTRYSDIISDAIIDEIRNLNSNIEQMGIIKEILNHDLLFNYEDLLNSSNNLIKLATELAYIILLKEKVDPIIIYETMINLVILRNVYLVF